MNLERPDAVNWSSLKHILTSPRHYLHNLRAPRVDTDALRLGRLIHAMVYEPDTVGSRYVVMPRFHGGMNDDTAQRAGYDGGKQAKAAWESSLPSGAEVVESDHYKRAAGMRDAILADPHARALVVGGKAEQPIEWVDRETGIRCRGRVDHIDGVLSDLKSTARIDSFGREAARFKYHAQIAWYANGLREAGYTLHDSPLFLAVESSLPHDVAVFTVPDEAIQAGDRLWRRALAVLAECRESGLWPGVSGGTIARLEMPAYALADDDDVEITMGGEPLM